MDAERIKIPLSERRPVTITPADWPIVASAEDGEQGEITVRRHADGRVLVYCERPSIERRGGFLLNAISLSGDPEQDLLRSIRRCAGIIDADELGDSCIAAMAPEEI
jgi:hypothetical protein